LSLFFQFLEDTGAFFLSLHWSPASKIQFSLVIYWWNQWDDEIFFSGGGRRKEGNVHMDSLVPGTTLSMNLSLDGWEPRMAFGSFEWIHLRMNYDIHGWF
jgi:hypothetical protein